MADTRFTAHKILREQWLRDRVWFLRAKFQARVNPDCVPIIDDKPQMEVANVVDG